MTPQDFLSAARVPHSLKPQSFGLWTIQRLRVGEEIGGVQQGLDRNKIGWEDYTLLRCMSMSSLHLEHIGGEIVMEDSAQELRKHLPIWMAAKGRVLVTGLGLGCVVRGLLANDAVEHIDVVEIDTDIVRVVGQEFASNPRVTIHVGDALEIEWPADAAWDYAWHDIWCDGNHGLNKLHTKLLARHRDNCCSQGAWAFPRSFKKVWARHVKRRLLG